jgi:hypothetical protein
MVSLDEPLVDGCEQLLQAAAPSIPRINSAALNRSKLVMIWASSLMLDGTDALTALGDSARAARDGRRSLFRRLLAAAAAAG